MVLGSGGDLGSARGQIIIDTDRSQRNVSQLQGSLTQFGNTSTRSLMGTTAAGYGLIGMGTAMLGVLGFGVKKAADFEQAIDAIAAVSGSTGAELDSIREKALQLGKDTAFSATEAANAMEELAKAGVTTEDILNGAADGAVALAAAAGTSLPIAATLISTALNQFQLTGDQATRVADLFAGAAAASAADATEIGEAFAYVGTRANQLNISIEDTTNALALLAQAGVKGSRGGTSLNSLLGNLATPTQKGAEALAEMTVSVYDATGAMRPLEDILVDINKQTEGLSDQAREDILGRVFDEQGMRAIIPLLTSVTEEADAAGKGWDDYREQVTKEGVAAEQAAARMDNLKGSLEELSGSLETVGIAAGSVLLPLIQSIVEGVTGGLNALLGLGDGVAVAMGIAFAAMGTLALAVGGFAVFGPQIARMAEAFKFLGGSIRGLLIANPILLALGIAIAALTAAYLTNFGGFADFVDSIVDKVGQFTGALSKAFKQNLASGFDPLQSGILAIGTAIKKTFGVDLMGSFILVSRMAGRIGMAFSRIGKHVREIGRAFGRGGLRAGFESIFGREGQKILANVGDLFGALPRTIGTALRQIETGFDPLDNILKNAGSAFQQFGRFIENVFAGDFDKALENLRNIGQRIVGSVPDLVDIGKIVISGLIELGGMLGSVAGRFWDWLKGRLLGTKTVAEGPGAGSHQVPAGDIVDVGKVIVSALIELAGEIGEAAADFAGWIWDQLTGGGGGEIRVEGPPIILTGDIRIRGTVTGGKDDPSFIQSLRNSLDATVALAQILNEFFGPKAIAIAMVKLAHEGAVQIGALLGRMIDEGVNLLARINPNTWGIIIRGAIIGAITLALLPVAILAAVAGLFGVLITGLIQGLIFGTATPSWSGLSDAVRNAITAALSIALNIGSALADIAEDVANFVAGIGTGLTSAIVNANWDFSAAGAAIGGAIIDSVGNFIKDNWNPLDWFGGDSGDTELGEKELAQIEAQSRPSGGGGAGHGGGFDRASFGDFTSPENIPAPDEGALAAAGQKAAAAVRGGIGDELKNLAQEASTATQTFNTAFSGGMVLAVGIATQGALRIRAALSLPDLGSIGFRIGQSLGNGIAIGISSTINAVAGAAARLVGAAVQAAERAAAISSPSALMASAIGVPLGEGVAAGILSTSGKVAGAMNAIMPNGINGGAISSGRGGGATTVIHNTFQSLRSDEFMDILDGSRAGRRSGQFIEEMTGSVSERFNSTRRWT